MKLQFEINRHHEEAYQDEKFLALVFKPLELTHCTQISSQVRVGDAFVVFPNRIVIDYSVAAASR